MNLAAFQGLLRSLRTAGDVLRGQPVVRRTRDRAMLERRILPAYACRHDVRRVLFVGCARYTQHYERLFGHAEYWTIDPAPRNRRWGARRHIRARLEQLDRYVAPGHFDLIVCNGVLGWGLDRHEDAEAAFSACHRALRPGGELVLGWNDVFPHSAVRPESIAALGRFARSVVDGIGGPSLRIGVQHRHVFEFYRKPSSTEHGDSVVGARGALIQSVIGRHAPSMHKS